MKNTDKYIKTVEEWRNCPMSNFICSVGIETRLETNMPRGRMLLLSLLNSGAREWNEERVNRIYECCLCGLCTQCGFDDTDIPAAIAAGRADINEAGLSPEKVKEFAQMIRESCIWENADVSKLTDKPVVFITSDQGNADAFGKIARKAGADESVIVEGKYDSALLYELGIWDISEKYTDKIIKFAEDPKIKSVVIDSPHLWARLKGNKKVIHVTEYIKNLIDNGNIKLKASGIKNITYHDPCKLVRNAKDETTVRGILSAAKVELKELRWNKKDAKCCGGPTLKICAPEISKKITIRRIEQINDIKAENLVVACNHCYSNFNENKPGFKVIKILDFVLDLIK
jgi:Fe-S oxidoreductase